MICIRKITICLLGLFFTAVVQAQTGWPAVTATTKPWTRWWWLGSAVDSANLRWNLEEYQKAGLGGVEITPIYGTKGEEKRFLPFLSSGWMQLLSFTLQESKRLGLGVDLANGTGWPFGGPWVSEEDASKTIYHQSYAVQTGKKVELPILYREEGWVRTANNQPLRTDQLKQPLSANQNFQQLALDQVRYPNNLKPLCVVAVNNNGHTIDVTGKLTHDFHLDWVAPAGEWKIHAVFQSLHGKMVERAAPGGEGYAIDHFSADAAHHYFARFDEAFKGYDLSYLRGFFNDSYEVDDARGQANWTPDFFWQFKKRKGYDLRKHLPALFGERDTVTNSRVRFDYRAVIDELILENFTKIWKQWGGKQGKLLRNQSHGSPANTLDLYSVVDIPETEGTDVLRFKFASSAAHVTGKKLVAAEATTWLDEHFQSSWADVKKAIDLYFLGGVNHIVYHGTSYSPKDAAWPGWLFYAAVHYQPNHPQWKHFTTLNQYITRVQSFLQQGKAAHDVLVYYPIADRYAQPGRDLLQHFDGMHRNFEHTVFDSLSQALLKAGIGFDFFSDRQLQQFSFRNNRIQTGGIEYRTILLPANQYLDEGSLKKIMALARVGARILVYRALPTDVPGMTALEKRRGKFQKMIAALSFETKGNLQWAKCGKGHVIVGNDLEKLLEAGTVTSNPVASSGLSFIQRKTENASIYFINNRTGAVKEEWVSLPSTATSFTMYNAMTGEFGKAETKSGTEGWVGIRLSLQPWESLLLVADNSATAAKNYPYRNAGTTEIKVKGQWQVTFVEGGPVLPAAFNTDELMSWTASLDTNTKNFSGIARYSIQLEKPADSIKQWVLDLGAVHESARVILNGKELATLIGPVYQCVIPEEAWREKNVLEVEVANGMANRIAYMDRQNIPWKIFYNINMPARKKENERQGLFDAGHWLPAESGLIGPVLLKAVE